eukprot:TRINITY_DN7655_c0_g1_i1.p1 TRINITY_DN7655_c0_g1~~TRINITY_DN7655_c0_g1_i1.p1  ORF type:complete len:733 (-),score=126.38 TRINITY_DN7655_c0_g1_i1:579-2483(-)
MALDIAKGLSYLHGLSPNPIVHRDLRSPNVFVFSLSLNDSVRCKIADFGLSDVLLPNVGGMLSTWQWLPPEVIDVASHAYNEKVDVYSFAMVLVEISTRRPPFDELFDIEEYTRGGKGFNTQKAKMRVVENDLRPPLPDSCPLSLLARRCWAKLPSHRPSARDAVRDLSRLLDQLMQQDLAASPPEDVQSHPRMQVQCAVILRPKATPLLLAASRGLVWCYCADRQLLAFDAQAPLPSDPRVVYAVPSWESEDVAAMLVVTASGPSMQAQPRQLLFCVGSCGGLRRVECPVSHTGRRGSSSVKSVAADSVASSPGLHNEAEEIVCCIAHVRAGGRSAVWVGSICGPEACCSLDVYDAASLAAVEHIVLDAAHPPSCATQDGGCVWVGSVSCAMVVDACTFQVLRTVSFPPLSEAASPSASTSAQAGTSSRAVGLCVTQHAGKGKRLRLLGTVTVVWCLVAAQGAGYIFAFCGAETTPLACRRTAVLVPCAMCVLGEPGEQRLCCAGTAGELELYAPEVTVSQDEGEAGKLICSAVRVHLLESTSLGVVSARAAWEKRQYRKSLTLSVSPMTSGSGIPAVALSSPTEKVTALTALAGESFAVCTQKGAIHVLQVGTGPVLSLALTRKAGAALVQQ